LKPFLAALLLASLTLAGCEAPMRLAPGTAGLRVEVRATPKSGFSEGGEGYLAEESGPSQGAYARVDYARLRDIVVWLEPGGTSPAPPPPALHLDIPTAGAPLLATSPGGALTLSNRGSGPINVFSVSAASPFDTGPISPGAGAEARFDKPGVVELLSDQTSAPLGAVYVAPTPWVRLARHGETLEFSDLPPGPCRVQAWHPRLPASSAEALLIPDRVSRVRVLVSVNALKR
jgi:hypothetical protein